MSVKTIPAQTIRTCDICGVVCDKDNSRQNARLLLKRDALDWAGHAVASANIERDLCDSCVDRVANLLNAEEERVRVSLLTA